MTFIGHVVKFIKNKRKFRAYWKFQHYIKKKMGCYIYSINQNGEIKCGNPYEPFQFTMNLNDPETLDKLNAMLKGDYKEDML